MSGDEELPAVGGHREQYRNRLLRALGGVDRCLERTGQQALALGLYTQGLQADPLAEGFYRRKMSILRNLCRYEEAIEMYTACKLALQNGLNVEPGPETEAIYQALLREI